MDRGSGRAGGLDLAPGDPFGPAGIVLNHAAGTDVLSSPKPGEALKCEQYAATGQYVVLVPAYRDLLAPGAFCDGEADDVVAMIDRARTLPWVDDSSIVIRGVSLGGCAALQIYERGLPGLKAVASVNGPTDMAATYEHSAAEYNANTCALLSLVNPRCK